MLHMPREEKWMLMALKEAEAALGEGEEPVGTIIVEADSGLVVARAHQQMEALSDSTAHSLMIALTQLDAVVAARGQQESDVPLVPEYAGFSADGPLVVVTTREPCIMCAGALLLRARIQGLIYGVSRNELGACDARLELFNKRPSGGRVEVQGEVLSGPCRDLLRRYQAKRASLN